MCSLNPTTSAACCAPPTAHSEVLAQPRPNADIRSYPSRGGARAADLIGCDVRTDQIEDWRLDTEAASPGYHVAEYVLAFGRRTTLNVSQRRRLQGRPGLRQQGHAKLHDTAVGAAMNLGTARHVAPVVLILSAI